jgi:hypothetical protein
VLIHDVMPHSVCIQSKLVVWKSVLVLVLACHTGQMIVVCHLRDLHLFFPGKATDLAYLELDCDASL